MPVYLTQLQEKLLQISNQSLQISQISASGNLSPSTQRQIQAILSQNYTIQTLMTEALVNEDREFCLVISNIAQRALEGTEETLLILNSLYE